MDPLENWLKQLGMRLTLAEERKKALTEAQKKTQESSPNTQTVPINQTTPKNQDS